MYLPRTYNAKPGNISETQFLLWAAEFAEGCQLRRTSHPDPETLALGWRRGTMAVARAFRALALS